jgi:serine/threonine protein kinase
MGRVYKVRQTRLDRVAALKVLPPALAKDPAWVERFHREARALARLNHPHIVQVFDFGQTEDPDPFAYLLMEFVDGVNLRQAMRQGGLTAREALVVVPKLCEALHYAHESGVLHRDLKPENILIDAQGRVKIVDFGLAKFVHSGNPDAPASLLTQSGMQLGTAAYMAPEQIEHPEDVDHRADIYSLGVVFYEMLTGGLPLGRFPAPSETSGVDPRLDPVVFRTLEKQRDRRYQNAGDVSTDVRTIASAPGPPHQVPRPPLPPRRPRFSAGRLIAMTLLFAVLGLLGVILLSPQPSLQAPGPGVLAQMPSDDLAQVATGISVDHEITADGDGSMKIDAAHGAVVTVGEMEVSAVAEDETLWLEASLRAKDVPAGAGLEVWCVLDDGSRLLAAGQEHLRYGTQDWQTLRWRLQVPEPGRVRRVLVNAVISGPGTLWVDAVRLTAEK